jgi:hypothetical protein
LIARWGEEYDPVRLHTASGCRPRHCNLDSENSSANYSLTVTVHQLITRILKLMAAMRVPF